MRDHLETVDAVWLAQLLGNALDQRAAGAGTDRLRVMCEARSTVARLAPVDDLTALAAGLNHFGNTSETDDVVFADRWAAGAAMGRGDGLTR